jgi:ligand-binding sensor domain-containing protein
MRLLRLFTALLLLPAFLSSAQNAPVGTWTSHLPYNNVIGLATDGQMIYAASELTFFTYDPVSGEMDPYSKTDGMADVGMAGIGYDNVTGTVVLTYTNGNIDLFKNKNFYNIPDFKIRIVNGSKDVHNLFIENGLAYISTSVGIIVVDLEKREIKETWEFAQNQTTIPIYAFGANTQYYYATTPNGVYRINRNSPSPQVFSLWEKISNKIISDVTVVDNKMFFGNDNFVYIITADTLNPVFNAQLGGKNINAGNNRVLISYYSGVAIMNPYDYNIDDTKFFNDTRQAIALGDGSYWVADMQKGLAKFQDNPTYIKPNGPSGSISFDIYAYDRNILVAHGGTNDKWNPISPSSFNPNGFSEYKDGTWVSYGKSSGYEPLKNVTDFVAITKDRTDGTIYAGSFRDGLFILKADGSHQLLRENSPIDESVNNGGTWQITALALDKNNTLWLNQFGVPNELAAKSSDNAWYKFNGPFVTILLNSAAGLIIDDVDQKWYYSPLGGGVFVVNDGGTLDNKTDDQYKLLTTGAGLPDNDVYSLAKDKNNAIWVGTRAGIGIFNCAESIFTDGCTAEKPIVQYDQFAGELFKTEIVYAIAVDGANRKWIGTANGVWLLSPDAQEIVYRFTAENSPLPSNVIKKITVDPVTGDVYIGTEKGLVCYRSTATDGGEENEEQLVTFPNPVPSGYSGTIAIKGFVENADVRITDISGQLVYRTTALGGQAVWNGLDYKGRRPQSGVYYVFATNKDGTQKTTGKIVFRQ